MRLWDACAVYMEVGLKACIDNTYRSGSRQRDMGYLIDDDHPKPPKRKGWFLGAALWEGFCV